MLGLLLVLATCAGACSADHESATPAPEATPRVFTGEVAGTDAQVSAIVTSHHARLYFCGGASTYTTLSRWIPAVTSRGEVTADETAGKGFSVRATLDGDELSGTLSTGDAGAYSFHAGVTNDGTVAGLYEATSPCGKVGVIVTQATAKDEPAAQGACIGTGNVVDIHQVNPVLPLVRTKDGSIRVVVDGSSTEVLVRAAAPPAD
jgi:hypothetical protein